MKTVLALLLFFLLTGCSTQHPPLATVNHVELERYLGTWYEIARYEHFFEKGCTNVTATYTLKEDGNIDVLNTCVLEDGTFKAAQGTAHTTDTSNTKLKVTFFWPFYGDYWVVLLDDDYRYAVIGER